MGYSRAQKARTHKRIVAIAAKRFREKGLAGFGIAELMKEAGLTVGGFYKHFDSRDHLVAEAVSSAFGGWKRRVDAAASGGPPVSYEKLIDDYLNQAHRDNPGTGCAFSALAPEIARSDKRTRALASEQVRNDIQGVNQLRYFRAVFVRHRRVLSQPQRVSESLLIRAIETCPHRLIFPGARCACEFSSFQLWNGLSHPPKNTESNLGLCI